MIRFETYPPKALLAIVGNAAGSTEFNQPTARDVAKLIFNRNGS